MSDHKVRDCYISDYQLSNYWLSNDKMTMIDKSDEYGWVHRAAL
jgi:hypothetical protein